MGVDSEGCHVVDHTKPEIFGQRPGSRPRPRPRPISIAALEFCMNDLKNDLVVTQTKYLVARPLYERMVSNPQVRYQNNDFRVADEFRPYNGINQRVASLPSKEVFELRSEVKTIDDFLREITSLPKDQLENIPFIIDTHCPREYRGHCQKIKTCAERKTAEFERRSDQVRELVLNEVYDREIQLPVA